MVFKRNKGLLWFDHHCSLTVSVLATFLSLQQNIDKKQLKGRRIYFGSQFEGLSPWWQGRLGDWWEHEVAGHTASTVRKHREMNAVLRLSIQSMFRMALPSSVKPLWKCPHRHIQSGCQWRLITTSTFLCHLEFQTNHF